MQLFCNKIFSKLLLLLLSIKMLVSCWRTNYCLLKINQTKSKEHSLRIFKQFKQISAISSLLPSLKNSKANSVIIELFIFKISYSSISSSRQIAILQLYTITSFRWNFSLSLSKTLFEFLIYIRSVSNRPTKLSFITKLYNSILKKWVWLLLAQLAIRSKWLIAIREQLTILIQLC